MLTDTSYAIVGTGNIGSALARLFGRAGLEVQIANTRGPGTISELAASAGPSVLPVSLADALARDVIFLAIPFTAVEQFGKELPDGPARPSSTPPTRTTHPTPPKTSSRVGSPRTTSPRSYPAPGS